MNEITINFVWKIDGMPQDVTSAVLADPTGTYGIKRSDTDAVVIGPNTPLVRIAVGTYQYSFTPPASGLTYEYYIKVVYLGTTYSIPRTIIGVPAPDEPYQTVEQIRAYAATKFHTEKFDETSDALVLKAAYEASRIIDSLYYIGDKLDSTQYHEFPRTDQTSVPQDILNAHSEIAIEIIESDGESLRPSDGVVSERFAAVGITYDSKNTPIWLRLGVPSEIAWSYLLKYLREPGGVILRRVS